MRHDESSAFGSFLGRPIEKTQADADNIIETVGKVPVNKSSLNR